MIAKMNHSDELTLLKISGIGVVVSYFFEHLREISAILAIVAALPVIYERYKPIVNKLITKINSYVGKNK